MLKKLTNKLFLFIGLAVLAVSPVSQLYATSKSKEDFTPLQGVFSDAEDIDYKGLQAHLHHEFKDVTLLKDALFPMLPQKLRGSKDRHELLEWQGDAVLELIVTDRLLEIFPDEDRPPLNKLRQELVRNKTLTDIFYENLDIEQFLPRPESEYIICNVVEALIGAVYRDSAPNGMTPCHKTSPTPFKRG
ncbi:MAG: ribonuclease III domain-containing protein [Alphaproteobacteria bacterium]|jgi:dsRNA-specific ribonuclease